MYSFVYSGLAAEMEQTTIKGTHLFQAFMNVVASQGGRQGFSGDFGIF